MLDVPRKVHDAEIWTRASALYHHFNVHIPIEYRSAVKRQWCDVFRGEPIERLDHACAAIIRTRHEMPTTSEIFNFVSVIGGRGSYFARALSAVAAAFGVREGVILGPRRHTDATRPRFALYLLTDESGHYKLQQIGKRMDRDHTSVLHGIRRAKELEASDPDFAVAIREARRALARTNA